MFKCEWWADHANVSEVFTRIPVMLALCIMYTAVLYLDLTLFRLSMMSANLHVGI